MSSSSRVMQPIPFRTSVGAICEIMPPAPMHVILARENLPWSNPGIFLCRSSAPAMALPLSLIELCETVDTRCMFFHSVAVDFDFQVLIQPHESHKAIAAEDGHDRH